jgi:DNA mismatch repair protein MutS
MAGMPNSIVLRANEILHHLEKEKLTEENINKLAALPARKIQLSLFESDPRFGKVKEILGQIDINTISPVEALLKLNEIKVMLKNKP